MKISTDPPIVSVVVLSYNRLEYTYITIKALSERSSGVKHELIVVDNGSEPPASEVLQEWSNRGLIDKLILLPENLGTSAGFNMGFEASDPNSRFLTKLDNDIQILSDNWLAEILAIFEEVKEAGIVSTDMVNHASLKKLKKIKLASGREVKDWSGWRAGGGGMTFRRETYERYGGFSENFPADLKLMPDDFEYYYRLASHGLKGFYACASQSQIQTDLNEHYEEYGSVKKRQYHLLKSRFFSVAKGSRSAFNPYIVNADFDPIRVEPGMTITIQLAVNSSKKMTAGIGMTLSNTESKKSIYDPKNDSIISLTSGHCDCERKFFIPESTPVGFYNVSLSVCEGKPGKTERFDRYKTTKLLEVIAGKS